MVKKFNPQLRKGQGGVKETTSNLVLDNSYFLARIEQPRATVQIAIAADFLD